MTHAHHWHLDLNLHGTCGDCDEQRDFPAKPARYELAANELDSEITSDDYELIATKVASYGQEHDDTFQEAFLALWEAKPTSKRLAYTIARRQVIDYWRKRLIRTNGHVAIDQVIAAGSDLTWADLLVDLRAENELVAHSILATLPSDILTIGIRKLAGDKLASADYKRLERFSKAYNAA